MKYILLILLCIGIMSCSPSPDFPTMVTGIQTIETRNKEVKCLYSTGPRTWVDYCGKYNVGDTVSTFKVH